MSDLLVRNVALPDGRADHDLLALDGRIAAIGPALAAPAGIPVLEGQGLLLAPPFVDAHFHMDATLSVGLPRVNQQRHAARRHRAVGRIEAAADAGGVIDRALQYCDWAVAKGLLAIRSHVDICDDRLLAVEALLQVREQVKPWLDLQLVAFPQDGLLRSPNALANLKRALAMGVDVVGGIPHFERTMSDGAAERAHAVRTRRRARPARGHALRRERRPAVAPHRDAGLRDAAPRPARARDRLAPDLDALDGQLLRDQAAAADARGGAARGRQPADQHHAAGPARHATRSGAA